MKFYLSVAIVFFSFTVNAQSNDTTMVERYCGVTMMQKGLSAKVVLSLDFGNEWNPVALKDEMTAKIKSFNSVIDAFNYMGSMGWKYVNSYADPAQAGILNIFIFRKSFKKE